MISSFPDRPLPNHRCPVCGESNACAPAACGRFDVACWCRNVTFTPQVLALVPAEAKGLACLCERCARGETLPKE